MSAVAERVENALRPVVAERGLDLEGVDVQAAGRRRLVRILVDRDGGIPLDDVADLSHVLSEVLDETEAMGELPYVLEVSSPGLDRPLTLPRHWRRAIGHLVNVDLADGTTVSGRVLAANEQQATLDTSDGQRDCAYASVAKAKIEVEFTHPSTGHPAPDDE